MKEIAAFRENRRKQVETYYRQLGEAVLKAWPEPFSHTVLALQRAARAAAEGRPEELVTWVMYPSGQRDRARGNLLYGLAQIAQRLEKMKDATELRVNLRALVRGLLIREYKVDPAVVDQALDKPSFRERWATLQRLVRKSAGARNRGQGGARRQGGRPGGMGPDGSNGKRRDDK